MNSKKQRGGSCAAKRSLKGGSAAKKGLKGGNPSKKGLKGGFFGWVRPHTEAPHTEATHKPEATHGPEATHRPMHGGASKVRQLYCMKCRTKVTPKNVTKMSKKTKTRLVHMEKGVCPKCGTKVFGIVGGGH